MEKAIQDKRVDSKSSFATAFNEELKNDVEMRQTYKALNRENANAFRVELLQEKKGKSLPSRTHTKSWSRVDTTKGTYKALGTLIVDGGGWNDTAAIDAAITLAQKCLAMGQPWYMKHTQHGRVLYPELEFPFDEQFHEAWKTFSSKQSVGGDGEEKADGSQ
eukprot:TRINITY_DN35229_c0_g3_i1.p1 TRINITY_DN35229_c0_g3~~TRINITY_DN35229_c0_g3_i1.p1  ORF type:complete len:185 (+),score=43.11 TRINITY_DN35229_c0_g3_i1:72-557(+)